MASLTFCTLSFLKDLHSWLVPTSNLPKHNIPLPRVSHQTLEAKIIQDRPILIVGDIHGCYEEFKKLVLKTQEKIKHEDFIIICVGDMLNKGPNSLETLKYLQNLDTQGRFFAVRGNHEEAILREHKYKTENRDYVFPDRFSYLNSFSGEDFEFIVQLPYTLSIPKINSLIVHAGLVYGVSLEDQKYEDMTTIRNIVSTNSLFSGSKIFGSSNINHGVPWASAWNGPQHIYFGHDARRGLQKYTLATGLDTGCVYGKHLTGIVIDSSSSQECTFLSVDSNTSVL